MHKTARALAALDGRTEVTTDDVKRAAELVLPHRQRRRPFEQPHLDRERLDESLSRVAGAAGVNGTGEARAGVRPGRTAAGAADRGGAAGRRLAAMPHGRRNPTPTRERGHYVRAVPDEKATDVAVDATIRRRRPARRTGRRPTGDRARSTCTARNARGGRGRSSCLSWTPRGRWRRGGGWNWSRARSSACCKAPTSSATRSASSPSAGRRRKCCLPPTGSVELAERALRSLPTGGRTPLAHALVIGRRGPRRAVGQPECRRCWCC